MASVQQKQKGVNRVGHRKTVLKWKSFQLSNTSFLIMQYIGFQYIIQETVFGNMKVWQLYY